MTKIPDDVVERAARAIDPAAFGNNWRPARHVRERHQEEARKLARAAGEVFVAWEREQCETLAKTSKGYPTAVSKAIRARSAPEKK